MRRTWTMVLGSAILAGALHAGCGPVREEGETTIREKPGAVEESPLANRHAPNKAFQAAPLARSGAAVASGGGKYLAVWGDIRQGGIYGTRVARDGTVLDPEGIRINVGTSRGRAPAIAFDGTHFFVVWETGSGIEGIRVGTNGTVKGKVFSVISSGETFGPVRIACSPQACLVTFTVIGTDESVIHFKRVSREGVVQPSPDETVSQGFAFAFDSAVTWNPSTQQFLVVWSDARGDTEDENDIYGNRVSESGIILDGTGFAISTSPGLQVTPDVAWTGRRFQVVWSDLEGMDANIRGALVRRDGSVETPAGFDVSVAPGQQRDPRLAHHGSKSLVVWDDTREGSHRVWGTRLGEDGSTWDPAGFPVSGNDTSQAFGPAVAYGGNRFLAIYGAGESSTPGLPHFVLGTRVGHDAEIEDSPALPLTLEPRPGTRKLP
ncbi:hypothetical protein OWM54_39675 [Myxococcus sp. MISCRS1]|uniref:hypothetical protein n=1 Tax=Myxococcus sp. MISCRS1 TaxID=2996786 RepID=UPI00226D8242|nr:hypothetical protein [Myxococcus sp. MISCRS1]MCY1003284.1 hypothetical protein [Myxococcus sp. MISCRS1]